MRLFTFNILLKILSLTLSFSITRLLIQHLGLVEFGTYSLILAVLAIPLSARFLGLDMHLHKVLVSAKALEIKKLRATVTLLHCLVIVFCTLFFLLLYGVFVVNWELQFILLIMSLYFVTATLTFVQDISKFTFRPLRVQFSGLLFFTLQIFLILLYLRSNNAFELDIIFLVIIVSSTFTSFFLLISSRLHVFFNFIDYGHKFYFYTFFKNMRNGYSLVLFGVLEAVLFLLIRKFIQIKHGDLELGIYATAMVVLGCGVSLFRAVLIEYEPKCYKLGQTDSALELSRLVSFHIFLVVTIFMVAVNLSLVSGEFWISLMLPNEEVTEVVKTIIWYSMFVFSWIACLVVYPVAIAKSDNTKSFYRLLKFVLFGVSVVSILSVWLSIRSAQVGLAISLLLYVYSELRRYSVLPTKRESKATIKIFFLNTFLCCCGYYFLNYYMVEFHYIAYIAFTLIVLLANVLIILKSQISVSNK